jgi:4-amino-4-deoxy-L-arabinose transferase-like glycosyltransferase
MALILSKEIRTGSYNFIESIPYGMGLDDTGYYTFLGFIYSIFGPNILIARIIEAIIGALSGVIIYKIGLLVFNHSVAKLSSIIFVFFPSFVYFNSLHLKETIMIFVMLNAILGIIKFQQQKRFIDLFISLLFILLTFYFRAILSILLLFTFLLTLLFSHNIKNIEKVLYTALAFIAFYFISIRFFLLEEYIAYWDYYSSLHFKDTMSSYQDRFVNSGQELARFASLPLLLVQSFTLPYPSMVQTNIRFFGVAAQWYHISGMFIYSYLAYWGILGVYDTIVKKNTKAQPLIMFLLMYTFVLIFSMYITAIIMNLIKISIMLPFIAYGLSTRTPKRNYGWVIYLVFISIIIFVWNFIKLSGRGII